MKDYKIKIEVSEVGGVYSANNLQEAEQIAQELCDNIYIRLNGKCRVEIESVEEVKEGK